MTATPVSHQVRTDEDAFAIVCRTFLIGRMMGIKQPCCHPSRSNPKCRFGPEISPIKVAMLDFNLTRASAHLIFENVRRELHRKRRASTPHESHLPHSHFQ